jgi:hypothetical protein
MQKIFLALIFTLVSLSASPAGPLHPDLFQCKGLVTFPELKQIHVAYSTTSSNGQAQMDIQLGNETVSRSGDEIMTQETILGTLVTVYRETDPDSPSEELTLIVPDINLTDELPKVRFKTRLFDTHTCNTIGGPALCVGPIQKSVSWQVRCKASLVNF